MLLYIHIPFCETRCPYCAFNSFTSLSLKEPYLEGLLKQLEFELEGVEELETIYIGGGTPSTLTVGELERLFSLLEPLLSPESEITIEANPTATREWIEGAALFANRISFGVQSFNREKLRFLGRNHTPKEAVEKVEWAVQAGFKRISIDLIYGCSCDTPSLLEEDIARALSLPIDHISAYALTLEEGTPFWGDHSKINPDEELGYTVRELIGEKLEQYEVSNFGNPSIHNLGYWELKEYIAHPLERRVEILTQEELRTERLFLGLRSRVGVDLHLLDRERVQLLLEEGKVRLENGRVYATNYFLADELALFLL
ncbi:MAG: radical SAM family heme chaperone HemW [Epsilonproteobacteria bacterium]|nr:coproporphyrinogen III oxidase [Campylobacterota bacterium]NPA57312.1 radical SAM family heme chaperone HemW [Campylobacterota bacterium]